MSKINHLIKELTPFGVKLNGKVRNRIQQNMLKLPKMDDTARFIMLLNILDIISKSKEYRFLASLSYLSEKQENTHRVNVVLDYIMEHYHEDIRLETAADLRSLFRAVSIISRRIHK